MASKIQIESVTDLLYENVRLLTDIEFIDEESYYNFLKQLVETLYDHVESQSKKSTQKVYEKTIEEQVRQAKDKVLAQKLLLFGSMFYWKDW